MISGPMHKRICFVSIALLCLWLLPSCETSETRPKSPPKELLHAAQAFRSKEPTDRYIEAQKLWLLLPDCPETFRRVTGSGLITAQDYSRPSYELRRDRLAPLLGTPFSITPSAYTYLANKRGNNKSVLVITFKNDLVVGAALCTYASN
jgi:hypothetical protein